MAQGTIKKLTTKGFGFIDKGGQGDLFFHTSAVQGASFDDLYEGQSVEYTEGRGQKGPRAESVRPV
ncbi:MAG TPA: cold shock domain-containing protein [Planctomycetaceae bacterium]